MSVVDLSSSLAAPAASGFGSVAAETTDAPPDLKALPWRARVMILTAGQITHGALGATFPDGRKITFRGRHPGPEGIITINDIAALTRTFSGGSLGFAEAYLDGQWDSDDVTAVLECVVLNGSQVADLYHVQLLRRVFGRIAHALRRNTKAGAKRNIQAHYDLGNAFYREWLDETMTYSSGLYADGATSLAEAQRAKYRALADRIDLQPGEHVLEIGCGWGGFAEYAAAERGARVTALTISNEQMDFARARIAKAGLQDKVEIRFQDYREVTGQFDKVASIEMFEAVGERYWPAYFGKIAEILKPGGKVGLQIITIADAMFDEYRRSIDFIQKYVFPGGMLPSITALKHQCAANGLTLVDQAAFGMDYARTLSEWRARFLAAWPRIAAMGFDDRFKRLWTYYMSYCEAGFKSGAIDLVQIALARP